MTMITMHIFDADRIYVSSVTVDEYGPMPPNSTPVAPPVVAGSEVALFANNAWHVLPERPVTAPPVPPVPPVPTSCTRRQGRLALLQSNKLDAVEAALAAIVDPTANRQAQIEYEADTWERGNAFLQSMWAGLGGTEAGLDDLFRLAVTL